MATADAFLPIEPSILKEFYGVGPQIDMKSYGDWLEGVANVGTSSSVTPHSIELIKQVSTQVPPTSSC